MCPKSNSISLLWSLIFALQRLSILFRPNSANAFLRIGVQGETMSFRSAVFAYLALYGSLGETQSRSYGRSIGRT
ncbi:hypothetical protein BWD14_07525 [Leptospira santarosai]|uniref:Secreted protein n=1 Tax=Leptospira santarosai TaxID=28183 RepID=A0AB73M7I8_9LEPT|nr:hypothetical protein BWD14_07525 [Leptospira santarosai]